jgi:glutaminase
MDCIEADQNIIEKSMAERFIIPDFKVFRKEVQTIYDECKKNNSGKVADYIPELAKANPDFFGLSVCTIDG